MKQETFNKLSLEKKMEIYNQWLYDSNLEQYELYTNDNECINQVEEFETLLNLIKGGLKHE